MKMPWTIIQKILDRCNFSWTSLKMIYCRTTTWFRYEFRCTVAKPFKLVVCAILRNFVTGLSFDSCVGSFFVLFFLAKHFMDATFDSLFVILHIFLRHLVNASFRISSESEKKLRWSHIFHSLICWSESYVTLWTLLITLWL